MSIFKGLFSFTNTSDIEIDKLGSVYYWNAFNGGSSNPDWIDIKDVTKVYECIPHLKIVINRKAAMFSNMKFKTVDENGNPVDNSETKKLLALLRQPNPLQSRQHWLMQFKIYEQLYGAAFIHKVIGRPDMLPGAMWNLPSALTEIKLTGSIYNQIHLGDIIKGYELRQSSGQTLKFENDEIIYSNVPSTENPIKGDSKIKTLQKPISNIAGALQFRNVIINKNGALGILSADNKDAGGVMPLGVDERKDIEKQHREMYGINDDQAKVIISETPVKYQAMTFPTKDLMLFEEVWDDFMTIIDAYGLNVNQFSRSKGTTFENMRQGNKIAYQDTIIPEAHSFTQLLTKDLGTEEKGFIIEPSFDHIPLLQENFKDKAVAIQTIANAVIALRNAGLITESAALLKRIEEKI
ncbi:MAG: phage portal protein [Promethearchaeota archaeon]